MNTWTSKTAFCLVLGLGVSACDRLPMPQLNFAKVLASRNEPGRVFWSAKMLGGTFDLVPPDDYCIEGDSLTESFALMTHCQVLAGQEDGSVDETDILTVTFSTTPQTTPPTVQELTDALSPLQVRNGYMVEGLAYVEVTDPDVQPELDPVHWRAVMVHNGTVIGFASYAPKGLGASAVLIDSAARNILDHNATLPDAKTTGGALKSNIMSIVGLFR